MVERKMKVVEERVKRLKELAKKIHSLSEYQASPDARDISERNLQVAIESCLDIGKIIISLNGLEEPKDNKGVFWVLAEAGILSKKSLSFLVPMAGTRNILVHSYDKIEDTVIYGVLKKHVDDFITFLREVRDNYLNKDDKAEKEDE